MKLLTLILSTFRELLSKATLYVLVGISTIVLLGTLAAVSSEKTDDGVVLKLFGNPTSPPASAEELEERVFGMQASLARGLFFGIMVFGVFATASVIPDLMEKGTIDLYLSKPITRWELLFGKSLGAIAAIFANILYFIGGLWFVFGIKTGVWNPQLLLSTLTMSFMFGCVFSIVALLGVLFRNAAIPIIGSFLYLAIIENALEARETFSLFLRNDILKKALDALYYLLPQVSAMQNNLSQQITHSGMDWKPFAFSLISSLLIFGVGVFALRKRDF